MTAVRSQVIRRIPMQRSLLIGEGVYMIFVGGDKYRIGVMPVNNYPLKVCWANFTNPLPIHIKNFSIVTFLVCW